MIFTRKSLTFFQNSAVIFYLVGFFQCKFTTAVVSRGRYSPTEYQALDKLRSLVREDLYRDYMREDAYLVQWLRFANFDVNQANQLIRKTHQWRKEKKIDEVVNEDWSDFEREYPYTTEGQDREGRPLMTLHFGAWNLRKIVLAGQTARYNLHLDRMMEIMSAKARETFNKSIETATGNRDVPDWVQIHDMAGYNLRTHGCLACVPAILTYAADTDSYFSYSIKSNYVLNSPRVFEAVYQLIRNLLSPRSRELIKLYGVDKNEWSEALLKVFSPEHLPPKYGGTKRV